MRHVLIVNPTSGPQNATQAIRQAVERLPNRDECSMYVTREAGDATRAVRRMCLESQEPARFYACGGDGTLNEVVDGAAGFAHAAVGCYPCGSGNDFVKYYGGKGYFTDIGALLAGREETIDLLRVNDRYAINVVNFGFDAVVANRMIGFRRSAFFRGHRAYYAAILPSIIDGIRHKCTLIADGEVFCEGELMLCTLANGDYVGGSFRCAPRADVADGWMEVCMVLPIRRLRFAQLIGPYQRGEHLENPLFADCVRYRRAKKLEIIAPNDQFLIALDGEILRGSHFTVECLPGAMRFIVPRGAEHADGGARQSAPSARAAL